MKLRKLATILAISSVMTIILVGCGSSKKESDASNKGGEVEAAEETTPDKFPEKLTAKKVGSINVELLYFGSGGLYYKDNDGKYGIMTFDGKSDTGAKYASCDPVGENFSVSDITVEEAETIEDLNSNGLVDAEGNEIIPQEYATIKVLNERYMKVCEVTEETSNKDEALVYISSKLSFAPADGDTLFKGNWYVYDITTGKKVEGVTGTQAYTVVAEGNYITYYTDEQEKVCVNAEGKALPEGARLLGNGSYILVGNNEGSVYDTDDKKLFTYKVDGFKPESYSNGYYIGALRGDVTKYVLMDEQGEIVSSEFEKFPTIYGTLLLVEDKVYDFEGNQVVDGSYKYVYYDKQTQNCWILENDKEKVFINEDGDILYKVKATDNITVDTSYFLSKTEDKKYYSLKDNDFVIEGIGIGPWLVKVDAENNVCDLVDVISGETIIESYSSYSCGGRIQSTMYIYARKQGGGMDIYTVK